jgi:hypothetical protein
MLLTLVALAAAAAAAGWWYRGFRRGRGMG